MEEENQAVINGDDSLENRPGIFMIGSPNVGKRTLLSRLTSVDFEDASDSSTDVLAHGWTINTKYYTADVSIWLSHLHNNFSIGSLATQEQLAALVMVFDISNLTSFRALKEWVALNDIKKFDILICIGNKVDLLPGHAAHIEYRRYLQRKGNSFLSPSCVESSDYGIDESEGVSLLGGEGDEEDSSWHIKRSCMEWCSELNVEYIEACASNADFDKCLSVDGDLQGVERLYGALSAHMWPGMVLKSGEKITQLSLPDEPEMSEVESDYEFEYQVLSAGSAEEEWDETASGWVTANDCSSSSSFSQSRTTDVKPESGAGEETKTSSDGIEQSESSDSRVALVTSEETREEAAASVETREEAAASVETREEATASVETLEGAAASAPKEDKQYQFEDLEHLMSEIGNVRNNLRLMPDFQRREMAATLALKMAAMFGDDESDGEGDVEHTI
ncbi:uncharacterized protein LOC124919753 [Impatiens glandulifera]|uniref:uncharacterized protein LOC124919753 n=1 Tax=Impatiens glandulifera TaxID=253017 RepID=UPI001FB17CAF|nr:uncharacterized protein LOC124919753 [Impatiens glandulifera]